LSLAQSQQVADRLTALDPELTVTIKPIRTKGDDLAQKPQSLGLKGLFVQEIEAALLQGRVDVAVHSAKDLPLELPPGLTLGPIPERGPVADVLVTLTGQTLTELPQRARVGTSSARRAAQLLAVRPDAQVVPLRGNLDTRFQRLKAGQVDALILAEVGLRRLGRDQAWPWTRLAIDAFLPAPGQGALALEIRADDQRVLELLAPLNHPASALALALERGVAEELGSGCQAPAAALAELAEGLWFLQGLVAWPDGSTVARAESRAQVNTLAAARAQGQALGRAILSQGGAAILADLAQKNSSLSGEPRGR
jgi:hydroxymethylbilane synthase